MLLKKLPISGDKNLILLICGLLAFGLVMIYNATAVYAQDLFGGAYRFVFLQIVWLTLGLAVFLFFCNYNYKNISKIAYKLFAATLCLLTLLAIIGLMPCSVNFPFAPCLNGANRWFYLNPAPLPRLPFLGVIGFQPSELAKFALILYLGVQLSKKVRDGYTAFGVYIMSACLAAFLIMLEPNMSTAALVFLIGTNMYFASGASLKPLLFSFPMLGILGFLFMIVSPYRRDRLATFLSGSGPDELSIGYHIHQILIALGSGGIFGVGIGQSRQKFQYLPETASDSIFAIIGEELGFAGTVLVVIAFGFLIYKGYTIAKKAPDLLGRLLAVGVTSWIGLQFFINVAAMVRLIPLTGVPIPLISYGGSSLVFTLMGLGILVNISKVTR